MFGLISTPAHVAPWGVVGLSTDIDGPPSYMNISGLARRGGNQQWTQSCVGWGLAGAICIAAKLRGIDLFPSPLDIYYWARTRVAPGLPVDDLGCRPDMAAQVIQELGVCTDTQWPFDPNKVNDEPVWDAVAGGLDWKKFRLRRIVSFGEQRCREVRRTLAANIPIVRGTVVDEAYTRWTLAMGAWNRTGPMAGAHMEVYAGYGLDGPVAVSSWGDGDRIESWEHLQSSDVTDLWTVEFAQ